MDGMMVFQIVMTSIGVLVPVGTLVYNAGKFGQRITSLEKQHSECRKERIDNEEDIFSRLGKAEVSMAYQKGLQNGVKS